MQRNSFSRPAWAPSDRLDGGGGRPTASLRVLVADGCADAADSLAWLLRLWNHEVRVAATGPDALAEALAWRPDAALVELVLPGFDGCELLRRWRAQDDLRGVVVIAHTGLADAANRRRAAEAGFALHLVKPVEPEALEAMLAALAEGKRKDGWDS
jgi:CheY-like chemotaxis protein